ncbi:glycoside hydrolase family 88 protein [Parabacteroides sp. AF17-28]|uniref:glycoside hydrolase family 88/105 protein n=1 Tax=Parabacteroides sp. AF17-28 TaxID=2292241 RepID=UPI0011C3AF9C|nr:glycoside hydrolase family 88 protein [Parabacteroides sp. AF17-28]
MNNRFIMKFLPCIFSLFIFFQIEAKEYSKKIEVDSIKQVVTDVVLWQINAYPNMNDNRVWKELNDMTWANGVFLSALATWLDYSDSPEIKNWCLNIAHQNNYATNTSQNSIYFADDFAICLMYAKLYEKEHNKRMLHHSLAKLDFVINNPVRNSLQMKTLDSKDRWSWADALYMAPPSFAAFSKITGDIKYLSFMDQEFWATYDYLYDKNDSLFYRDSNYFGKKEKNGKKVFWGRGNAWVVGGLCQILNYMPADFPSRSRYKQLFTEMMIKIASLQDNQGYWHASMLDPESYPSPETSSTGLFTYALWWGINQGLLEESRFKQQAIKGWRALVEAVHSDGMLGWVQPIGADPQKVTREMTEVYGPGAMMLAAAEIIQYISKQNN